MSYPESTGQSVEVEDDGEGDREDSKEKESS